MADIVMSEEAENDLVQIGDYIAKQFKSPKTALNIIKKIKDRIDELKNFPLIGTPLSSKIAIDTEYRMLGCGSYSAFYRHVNNDVLIDRIFHGRQEYIIKLFGDLPDEHDDSPNPQPRQ